MAQTPLRHFRCDDALWNALQRIGEELERTPSWLTRKAVEEYIERHRAAKRASKAKVEAEPTKNAPTTQGF